MEEENQDYWFWDPIQKATSGSDWEKEDYLWGSEYLWKTHCFGIPYYNPFRNRNQGMGHL